MQREYRVLVAYRRGNGTIEVINRSENPFKSRLVAEEFASKFTPPKFVGASVEVREVGEWKEIDEPI